MKFRAIFDMVNTMRAALTFGVPAVMRAILASPSLVFNPTALSRINMANIWIAFGDGDDPSRAADKKKLITPTPAAWFSIWAQVHINSTALHRTLAEIILPAPLAAHAQTVNYLDRTVVTKYIALEPNTLMHPRLRQTAAAAGYTEADGTLLVLSCGAEDTASILSSIDGPVDTIVSVLTLCTVPAPQQTIRALVLDVLAPGGTLLFFEHVRRDRVDAAWWQTTLTLAWKWVFDGCRLDRPTDVWVKELVDDSGAGTWNEGSTWAPMDSNDEENLFWIQLGRFVKRD
ncbi:S-adenosyl-L-methionine-dependent methyltransferase [Mycena capillaripes]|nr:S-adenosyl-L-methionine-dependent methyltransferase [Mycena capillaripes]